MVDTINQCGSCTTNCENYGTASINVFEWNCSNYKCSPICASSSLSLQGLTRCLGADGFFDCNLDLTDGCESDVPCCTYNVGDSTAVPPTRFDQCATNMAALSIPGATSISSYKCTAGACDVSTCSRP